MITFVLVGCFDLFFELLKIPQRLRSFKGFRSMHYTSNSTPVFSMDLNGMSY